MHRQAVNSRVLLASSCLKASNQRYNYGRGAGVGRGLGVGATRGVGVILGVLLAVGVGLGVKVGVGLGVKAPHNPVTVRV